jgi:hypothetical protein
VAFSLSKGITDSFSDYNAKATRWFIFLAWAKALNRDIALEQVIDFLKNVWINL